jgi:hypothetical protein
MPPDFNNDDIDDFVDLTDSADSITEPRRALITVRERPSQNLHLYVLPVTSHVGWVLKPQLLLQSPVGRHRWRIGSWIPHRSCPLGISESWSMGL